MGELYWSTNTAWSCSHLGIQFEYKGPFREQYYSGVSCASIYLFCAIFSQLHSETIF